MRVWPCLSCEAFMLECRLSLRESPSFRGAKGNNEGPPVLGPQILMEKLFHPPPHFIGQDVPRFLFDKAGEFDLRVHRIEGTPDRFNAAADFVDRAATVGFAKIQVQRAGSDQGGDV